MNPGVLARSLPSEATRPLAGLSTDSPALPGAPHCAVPGVGRAMQRLARCGCYPVGATPAVSSHRARCADRALTGELPSMVQRNQRNHFLPPAMTTALPSGLASGDSLQPQRREYILYRPLMLVNPHLRRDGRAFSGGLPFAASYHGSLIGNNREVILCRLIRPPGTKRRCACAGN